MISAVITFTLAGALLVILPGPDTMIVMRSLVLRGRPAAARTVAGVLTGLVIWVAAAVVGLSALVRASHAGYLALRVVGAAYLVTLGVRALRARAADEPDAEPASAGEPHGEPEPGTAADAPAAGAPAAGAPRAGVPAAGRGGLLGLGYVAGLACDLLNPKVGVFFVTFLPGFVPRDAAVGPTSALLGAIFVVESLAYYGVLLALVDAVTRLMRGRTARRRLDRLTGAVLVAFGVRIAVER